MDEHSSTRVRTHKRRRRFAPPYRDYEPGESRPSRRGRGRQGLILMAAGLAALWFAPWIVAKSPLASSLIARPFAGVDVQPRFDRLSLGWFSPITLEGFELRDDEGETLLKAKRIVTEKRLYAWLFNRHDLGVIRIDALQADLAFDQKSTNFETAFRAWLESDEQSRTLFESLAEMGLTSFEIELSDGAIALTDRLTQRRCALDNVDVTAKLLSLSDGLKLRLRGNCEQDQRLSPFELTAELAPAGNGSIVGEANELVFKSDAFPLWVAGATLRRFSPELELDGQLVSALNCQWLENKQGIAQATLKADCSAKSLYLKAAALQGDQVRLTEARLPIDLTWRANELNVSQARLETEIGKVSFAGTLDTSAGWLESLRRKPYQISGHVDLARLATMLPHTVRVRDDTRITAGIVDLVLNADSRPDGLAWQGKLETSQLSAVSGGQTINWAKPVQVSFDAHETPQALVVDRLYAESDFLEMQGEGTAGDGHLSATFDLDRLSRELGRFLDFGSLRMAGAGTAYLAWQRKPGGLFEAHSTLDAKKFELTLHESQPWREEQLDVVANLSGQMEKNALERIDQADLRVTGAGDVLTARLHQPVVDPAHSGLWSVAVALRGELARWMPRLRPFLSAAIPYEVAGNCDLSADLVYGASRMELDPLAAKIQNLRVIGPTVNIQEPLVDLSASTRWEGEEQLIEISNAHWSSSALVAEARDVSVSLDPQSPGQLKGNVRYSGDLARLWQSNHGAEAPTAWQLAGRLNGQLDVQRGNGIVRASFDNTVDQFHALLDGAQAWQEPQLRLVSHLEHNAKLQTLKLSDFTLAGQAMQCTAQGEIRDLNSTRQLSLDGRFRYDLAKLQPLWQQWVGNGLRLEGVDERPFSVRGPLGALTHTSSASKIASTTGGAKALEPLVEVHHGVNSVAHQQPGADWLALMQGNAEVHWTRGDLYGFALGEGDLRARLASGVLNFDPLDVAASQGKLHLAPTIQLSPGPMLLTMPAGRMADHIQITPEMCDRALKFAAPVMAGVTQAQGQFSVDLDGCRMPLADPYQVDAGGRIKVHSIQISPGPLVRELAVLMNRAAPAGITQESTVDFRVVNQRVYHKNLELVFPEFTLRTYGSVGFDETLAIMAEFPVPAKWIGNNRLGETLKNQKISLPIGGTLKAPKIDERALQQASAKFLRDAATGAMQNEVFRQLDRVLGPVTQ